MKRAGLLLAAGALTAAAVIVGPGPATASRAAAPIAPTAAGPATDTVPAGLRFNDLQVLGTHNSYHIEPSAEDIELFLQFDPAAYTLAYTHAPLITQLEEQSIRQFELDVVADPAGDLFRPIGVPGWKVLHIEQIDMQATCVTLVQCLQTIEVWSDAHPDHVAVTVQIEFKSAGELPGPPDAPPVTPELMATLDAEIRSVFGPDQLITPDDVRGSHATLEEAVLAGDGWPTVDESRGKVLVTLDNQRDTYLSGTTTLEGKVAFTPSAPGQPDAAFLKLNDPLGDFAAIQSAVAAGYIVRTRADSPVDTAISGDVTQRDAAFASGAQFVSTDYPMPGMAERWGTSYVAQLPGGGTARCNPVRAVPECDNASLENLVHDHGPLVGPPPPEPPPTTVPPSTTIPPRPAAVAPRFTG
jgi:hypothetical protein